VCEQDSLFVLAAGEKKGNGERERHEHRKTRKRELFRLAALLREYKYTV
jgi:hypothetical protein